MRHAQSCWIVIDLLLQSCRQCLLPPCRALVEPMNQLCSCAPCACAVQSVSHVLSEGDPTQEPTGLPLMTLQRVGRAICRVPDGFNCHPDVSGAAQPCCACIILFAAGVCSTSYLLQGRGPCAAGKEVVVSAVCVLWLHVRASLWLLAVSHQRLCRCGCRWRGCLLLGARWCLVLTAVLTGPWPRHWQWGHCCCTGAWGRPAAGTGDPHMVCSTQALGVRVSSQREKVLTLCIARVQCHLEPLSQASISLLTPHRPSEW